MDDQSLMDPADKTRLSFPETPGLEFDRLPGPVPVSEQLWPQSNAPRVSICCVTYNHEKFIREAIRGFLMQETVFPVEIVIHDDASTDCTPNIIREYRARYPGLVKAILQKENQTSRGRKVHFRVYAEARGEYIALCEGDDYWTDPRKLQKQADALDSDGTAVIAGHRVKVLDEQGQNPTHRLSPKGKEAGTLKDILSRNYLPTASVMIRRSAMPDLNGLEKITEDLIAPHHTDWPLWVLTAMQGKILFSDEASAVYRIHQNSVWNSLPPKTQVDFAVKAKRVIMRRVRDLPRADAADVWAGSYIYWAKKLKAAGETRLSWYFFLRAATALPRKFPGLLKIYREARGKGRSIRCRRRGGNPTDVAAPPR